MNITETYNIEDAFKALNESSAAPKIDIYENKLGYKGFEDLFDQVYCSLTHGEDRGQPRKILGDLGRVETKYADYDVSTDYSSPGAIRIAVVAPNDAIDNAIAVAEIYGLQYDVKRFGRGISKVLITVPEDEPVDRSLMHYVDTEGKLKDISYIYRDHNNKAVSSYSRRGELITAALEIEDENKEAIQEDADKLDTEESQNNDDQLDKIKPQIEAYLDNHEYPVTMDIEDICEEVCENVFDADYHNSDISYDVFTIVSNYFDHTDVANNIREDVNSSIPATPLATNDIYSFVDNLPEATSTRPPQAFKLGYIRELKSEIASKYRGGRGSEGEPRVRIFKASEYSRLYTKAAYENLASTKAFRKETGKEAGNERTGFHSTDSEAGNILNAIGSYPNGDLALQAYPFSDNKIKVAYFMSIDDADLVPCSKEDIAQYLTPASAAKVLNTRSEDATTSTSADNINRFKLSGIYMLGNLGHSII